MKVIIVEKQKGKPQLKPGYETVLIGFKGPSDLKEKLEKAARKLGISYSELLRTITDDFVTKSKGVLL